VTIVRGNVTISKDESHQLKMAKKKHKSGKSAMPRRKLIIDIIRNRANEIYEERMKQGIAGDADADWLRAEKELMN
jgi:hypothetical protein